jgi:hypothetical protein
MTQAQTTEAKRIAERALRDLGTIGRAWARYGLTVSKIALETSASTLQKTASVLGDLSATFRDREPVAEATQSAETADNKPS